VLSTVPESLPTLPWTVTLPLDLLRCPTCPVGTVPLTPDGGDWLAGACGHRFPVRDTIPVLLPGEERCGDPTAGAVDPPEQRRPPGLDLSVIIPALREEANLRGLLPQLASTLEATGAGYEILLVVGPDDVATQRLATVLGDRVRTLAEDGRGYGSAVRTGIRAARGRYVVTMDSDYSHPPDFLRAMWDQRHAADLLVASRYVAGGRATMPLTRTILSRTLNLVFRRGLSIRVRDMSSGYRLMRADAIRGLTLHARDFDLVQELLVKAYCAGWRVAEMPFHYRPRQHGRSHVALLRFGIAYLRSFRRLWTLRNSIAAADYDDRAYDSVVPLQRYWQRTRFRHVTTLIGGQGAVLDVGCGSSRIIGALPSGSVALDVLLHKLRHARRFGVPTVCASGFALPFADRSFPCVLSSEVIEHVSKDSPMLDELCRVLAPGGRLVLGTPDYASRLWRVLEAIYGRVAPGGYACEHISHYTRPELLATMAAKGLVFEGGHSILGAEMILAFRKPR